MDYNTPDLPVHHQLLEFTQTHFHGVGNAIQPSPPLLSPSPLAFNFSQHEVFSNESALHISSVQFSHSVVSDSLRPHEWQHARPPCPSPTPGAFSNWCPSGRWCHPSISSSVVPFSSCLQSFPASGSFQFSQFFPLGGQSIGASASASVLPMNIQDWFPWDWLVWSPCSPRDTQESSPTPQFKSIYFLALSFLYGPTLTSYTTTGKTIALTIWISESK